LIEKQYIVKNGLEKFNLLSSVVMENHILLSFELFPHSSIIYVSNHYILYLCYCWHSGNNLKV
jgi:hypothetical protein